MAAVSITPDHFDAHAFATASGIGIDDRAVHQLGDRKDRFSHRLLARDGVRVFTSSVALARNLTIRGWRIAVISACGSTHVVLVAAARDGLFHVRVEGVVADELGRAGKPDPAVLLEAARRLSVPPDRAVIVEDVLTGVEAARRGGFAPVVGVDRPGHSEQLRAHGADGIVADQCEVAVSPAAADGVGT